MKKIYHKNNLLTALVSQSESTQYSYSTELGLLSGQLIVIYPDNNVFIDRTNFTLFKCPLLASYYLNRPDCPLCQQIDPKFNCGWCSNTCNHRSKCSDIDIRSSNVCPFLKPKRPRVEQETPSLWEPLPSDNLEMGRIHPTPYIETRIHNPTMTDNTDSSWSTIFLVFALFLLVISTLVFVINLLIKTKAHHSRIASEQANFLSTTGPLTVDHNLIIGGDSPQSSSNLNETNNSISIVGLSQSTIFAGGNSSSSNGYKSANHQLYASHLPPIDPSCLATNSNVPPWLTRWFNSARQLSSAVAGKFSKVRTANSNDTRSSQHHGNSSTYQSGYTTNLSHHNQHLLHQLQQANSSLPLTFCYHQPPSSSTSSYDSSSAYYEEIGPGNLTKVNANQLVANRTLNMVDPFRSSAQDQQHLLTSNGQQQWQPTAAATFNHHHQHQLNNQHDLNTLQPRQQSSASSTGSATTNLPSVATPRHYLFASPSAMNAYKSHFLN